MKTLRALIVDDERLARNELSRLLVKHPEIELAGEAANAKEARRAIADLEPDLLFLDVEMPGETGFDLFASLDVVPLVVLPLRFHAVSRRDGLVSVLRAFSAAELSELVDDAVRVAASVRRALGFRLVASWQPSARLRSPHSPAAMDRAIRWESWETNRPA